MAGMIQKTADPKLGDILARSEDGLRGISVMAHGFTARELHDLAEDAGFQSCEWGIQIWLGI